MTLFFEKTHVSNRDNIHSMPIRVARKYHNKSARCCRGRSKKGKIYKALLAALQDGEPAAPSVSISRPSVLRLLAAFEADVPHLGDELMGTGGRDLVTGENHSLESWPVVSGHCGPWRGHGFRL